MCISEGRNVPHIYKNAIYLALTLVHCVSGAIKKSRYAGTINLQFIDVRLYKNLQSYN